MWVNRASCSAARSTTRGAAFPTVVTAIPLPKSMNELPSTSTTTPPPAWVTNTGSEDPTPAGSAARCLRSSSADFGPGISVRTRRTCASPGPLFRSTTPYLRLSG